MPRIRALRLQTSDGAPYTMIDYIAANGPVVGKVAKFDTDIVAPDFVFGSIARHRSIPRSTLQLLRGTLPTDRYTPSSCPIGLQLRDVATNQRARIQFDGEAMPVLPGSEIAITQVGPHSVTHKPIKVLVSR